MLPTTPLHCFGRSKGGPASVANADQQVALATTLIPFTQGDTPCARPASLQL